MRVSWSKSAPFGMTDPRLWGEVKDQTETVFAEAPAPDGVPLASGARMIELPCGVEIEFMELDEDHVIIVQASWP